MSSHVVSQPDDLLGCMTVCEKVQCGIVSFETESKSCNLSCSQDTATCSHDNLIAYRSSSGGVDFPHCEQNISEFLNSTDFPSIYPTPRTEQASTSLSGGTGISTQIGRNQSFTPRQTGMQQRTSTPGNMQTIVNESDGGMKVASGSALVWDSSSTSMSLETRPTSNDDDLINEDSSALSTSPTDLSENSSNPSETVTTVAVETVMETEPFPTNKPTTQSPDESSGGWEGFFTPEDLESTEFGEEMGSGYFRENHSSGTPPHEEIGFPETTVTTSTSTTTIATSPTATSTSTATTTTTPITTSTSTPTTTVTTSTTRQTGMQQRTSTPGNMQTTVDESDDGMKASSGSATVWDSSSTSMSSETRSTSNDDDLINEDSSTLSTSPTDSSENSNPTNKPITWSPDDSFGGWEGLVVPEDWESAEFGEEMGSGFFRENHFSGTPPHEEIGFPETTVTTSKTTTTATTPPTTVSMSTSATATTP